MVEARVIQVIEAKSCEGKGSEDNPYRTILEYFSPEGDLLATADPMPASERYIEALKASERRVMADLNEQRDYAKHRKMSLNAIAAAIKPRLRFSDAEKLKRIKKALKEWKGV